MLSASIRRAVGLHQCLRAGFASSAEATQKRADDSYNTFRTVYLEQQQKFASKIDFSERREKVLAAKRASRPKRVYKHPFHDPDVTPTIQSTLETLRAMGDLVGPEMISPHYENFAMSRKWAITYWVGYFAILQFAQDKDFHHFAASLWVPFNFWLITWYFWLEGRKSMLKPFSHRFHMQIVDHETKLMLSYWNDGMREYLNSKLDKAREQIEYYSVHEDYHSIKAESINRFLAIEQVNLKHHIQDRASRLLSTAEQMEASNKRYLINNVITDALSEVDRTLKDELDNIQEPMFESALIGIRKQKMTYENDPLLPLIRTRIEGKIRQLTSMSNEEKDRLVSLTNDQIESLRVLDRQIRDEFLKRIPKLEASVKAYPSVKKAMDSWSSGIQDKKPESK